ncbi:MAG: hypothetical protein JO002_00520 [Burkholderiaceae bacterium]|nr:hypothetical protein [Burkholderiaceae bacterium]
MKNLISALAVVAVLFQSVTAQAADEQKAPEKKSEPTQSQLALDHGPHATVTPAVKRKRLEAAQAPSAASDSK